MKTCPRCDVPKSTDEFFKNKSSYDGLCSYCKPCWKEMNLNYLKDHPRKKTAAHYYQELKLAVIQGYGSKCTCCGEDHPAFLTLDHVNGGGGKHRKERGTNAHYMDARRRNFPPDYRVLCYNCNCAQAHKGYCPHNIPMSVMAA